MVGSASEAKPTNNQMQKSTQLRRKGNSDSSRTKVLRFGQSIDGPAIRRRNLRQTQNVMRFSPAIGVAMIAIDQLYRRWDDIRTYSTRSTRPVADQTEELRRSTREKVAKLGKKKPARGNSTRFK